MTSPLFDQLYTIEQFIQENRLVSEISSQALLSSNPFGAPDLSPAQWLYFIFLPKAKELLMNDNKNVIEQLNITGYFEMAMDLTDPLQKQLYRLLIELENNWND